MIRKLLETGNLQNANKLLSRNWSIDGKVEKGRMMGRKIGFPTCNIDIGNYVIAKPGVYSVSVKLDKNKKNFKKTQLILYNYSMCKRMLSFLISQGE